MSISKVRLPNNTEEDIKAKYLIQSTSSDAVSEEFVTKTTTEDAIANIQKIYGNTIKFNQLNNFATYGDSSANNVTWVSTGTTNKTITVTVGAGGPTSGGNISFLAGTAVFIPGHVYYFSTDTDFVMSTTTLRFGPSNQAWFTDNDKIWQWPPSAPAAGVFGVRYDRTAVAGTYTFSNIMLIDLTQIYGAGSEPTTVAAFKADFPLDYYDYNPSGLLSVKATSIQSQDSSNNVIGNCDLNIPTLTGKLNGAGSSVIVFPNGMQSNGTTRDEMSATSAKKRIADDNSVLSTPQEYILDNALQLQYPVVAGGTEMVLPISGTAPMKMDVIYGNAADATSNLSSNFISVDSMKAFLNNLGTQMGGTWNMQYNNGKFEFTFSSS